MNSDLKRFLDSCVKEVRNAMVSLVCEIDGDFTGWCELGTMLVFRYTRDVVGTPDSVAILGSFNGEGHFWNQVNGVIVDSTVDQFGTIKSGVIDLKHYSSYIVDKEYSFDEDDLIRITDYDGVYDFVCENLQKELELYNSKNNNKS